MSPAERDAAWMRIALEEARRGLGRTWPNPAVGCVLVRDGEEVGRGHHARAGEPHAEAVALGRAGAQARGATAYVTLEPCAHHGRTPPCTDALVEAGVAAVVLGYEDPNPGVRGGGAALLREAGVEVRAGVLEEDCAAVVSGFVSRVLRGRPEVWLKAAATLDGQIAPRDGRSQWITGASAREEVHRLRDRCDAVLVGSGTVLMDDPSLTVRDPAPADGRQPIRVVLDRRGRTPGRARVLGEGCWVVTVPGSPPAWRQEAAARGAALLDVEAAPHAWLAAALARLGEEGLTRVLVEGGSAVHGSLLGARLADALWLFQAPKVLGQGGFPLFGSGFAAERLQDAVHLEDVEVRRLGRDWCVSGRVSYPPGEGWPG